MGMPTEVERSTGAGPRGLIRAPQNFVAGLTLIAIAAFAIWATGNLPQGTLRSMGPAMLPRWLAIGVGLCGLALAITALTKPGALLRTSDSAAILVFAVVLMVAAVVAAVVNALFFGGRQGANVFFYTALVVFYGTLGLMFVSTLKKNDWLETRGLRGPFFIVAGILAFAVTIRLFGLVVAGPLAMVIGGYATNEVREKEILIFAAVMTAFCVALFRYGLNLPIPIIIIPGVIHI
jgi:hypothetical protein